MTADSAEMRKRAEEFWKARGLWEEEMSMDTVLAFALSEVERAVKSATEHAKQEEREACAALMESHPDMVMYMYDRPGGPPGNTYVMSNNQIRANAIRGRGGRSEP
jgi:hypothetical protein